MSPSSKPVLSICIPTRDRSRYLQSVLQHLATPDLLPFPIEIIVSDNASGDDTSNVVRQSIDDGAPIRYFRHRTNIGVFANMLSAYRRAEGEFAVYLADDDELVAANLAEAVASLKANPHVVALFGPLEAYDAVAKRIEFITYHLPHDLEFSGADRLGLLDLLLAHHIIPEVPLLRARALGDSVFRSTNIYWAYTLIDRLLEIGSIRFVSKPYYRPVVRHWDGDNRLTVGTQASVSDWESYHRGLEYFYRRARLASPPLTPEQDADFQHRIAERRYYFLGGAFRCRLRVADYAGAIEIADLLATQDPATLEVSVGGSIVGAFDPSLRQTLQMFGAADLALEVLDHFGELTFIATFGFEASGTVATLLHHRRPGLRVEAMADVNDARFKTDCLLIAADAFCREILISQGFPQGRVIDFKRLLSFTTIP